MQEYEEPEATAQGTAEPDPERIRQLYEENRRLRKQIRQLKAAAAEKKKVEFSKLVFMGVRHSRGPRACPRYNERPGSAARPWRLLRRERSPPRLPAPGSRKILFSNGGTAICLRR